MFPGVNTAFFFNNTELIKQKDLPVKYTNLVKRRVSKIRRFINIYILYI